MTPYCYNQGEHSSHDENLMRGFVICIKNYHAQHPAFRYPELDDKDGQAKRSNMAQCGNQMKLVIQQHQRDTSNTWCDQNGTMNVDRWWLGRRWYQADRCHPFWHGHHNILFNISSVEQRFWIMMSWKDIDAITIKGNVNPERDNVVYGVDLILIMWLSSPLCLIIPYATCCYAVQILHMTNQSSLSHVIHLDPFAYHPKCNPYFHECWRCHDSIESIDYVYVHGSWLCRCVLICGTGCVMFAGTYAMRCVTNPLSSSLNPW